jgi:acetoacetyl-CoA synthetase
MVQQGDLLWTPSAAHIERAELTRFMRWLAAERDVHVSDYESLRAWSVADIEVFWAAVWDFYAIKTSQPYTRVLGKREMPGAEWFPGARLNFVEHVMRHVRPGHTAIKFAAEHIPLTDMSWDELADQVARFATALRSFGVKPGDRVVAFMPNIPHTMVAFLAAASLGAVWSCCSTDFGVPSVLDRFQQIEPTVLVCTDGYRYNGKPYDRRGEVEQIVAALPSLRKVVMYRYLDAQASLVAKAVDWAELMAATPAEPLVCAQVPADHPLWIVYSSGTTGLPKAIVHGHGGIAVELHKGLGLHCDLKPGSVLFFYTTSGWIMWNVMVGCLAVGATAVLYDGHPAAPQIDVLWRIAAAARATLFGASPTYLALMQNNGVVPREIDAFDALEDILLSGSPVTPESMQWLYDNVRKDLWVTSQSGGTDVAAGFVTGSVLTPVYAGEIQVRGLGVDIHAYNEFGQSVIDEVGELVVVQPMPTMPLYFWNDAGNSRYLDSYFREFPGVWRHGDFLEINRRGGCFIQGRSDSTLNRYGVRIGTAEIYRTVERLDGIEDSLIVNLDLPGGRFFMPMFVKLRDGLTLDDALCKRINDALATACSPRHVPDKIYAVEAIPYTLTGKKLEVPVRKILMGFDINKAVSRDAMQNPAAIDYFIAFAAAQADYRIDL